MRQEISFCPLCAGKLEAGDEEDQFVCEECESQFYIQIAAASDDDDDEY